MKKVYILFFIFSIILGYSYLNNCNSLPGRYYCYNNENAINWLDIKTDGTYVHYFYDKNKDIKLSNSGTWRINADDKCLVELDHWKSFNIEGINYKLYMFVYLHINNKYLDTGPDGENNTSFKKSDEDMSINPLIENSK